MSEAFIHETTVAQLEVRVHVVADDGRTAIEIAVPTDRLRGLDVPILCAFRLGAVTHALARLTELHQQLTREHSARMQALAEYLAARP
jgi:hypothetical protein